MSALLPGFPDNMTSCKAGNDPLAIERENSIMPSVADLVVVEVEVSERPQRPIADRLGERDHACVRDLVAAEVEDVSAPIDPMGIERENSIIPASPIWLCRGSRYSAPATTRWGLSGKTQSYPHRRSGWRRDREIQVHATTPWGY